MLSVRVWMRLNSGCAKIKQNARTMMTSTTATPAEIVHSELWSAIFPIASTAISGARTMTNRPNTMMVCTCVISLVERVISEAVEKRLISAIEKPSTASYSFARTLNE